MLGRSGKMPTTSGAAADLAGEAFVYSALVGGQACPPGRSPWLDAREVVLDRFGDVSVSFFSSVQPRCSASVCGARTSASWSVRADSNFAAGVLPQVRRCWRRGRITCRSYPAMLTRFAGIPMGQAWRAFRGHFLVSLVGRLTRVKRLPTVHV